MSIVAIIIAGLSIGFMGSFHCIGMCGPIALSLPVYNRTVTGRAIAIMLYNIGRAITYALLGGIFGFIGNRFLLSGYQQKFSILAGVCILLILIIKYGTKNNLTFAAWHAQVKNMLSRLLRAEKNNATYLLIGMANGFLPCGLVYLAIASSAAIGSIVGGSLLMFMFGLGTFPLMLSFTITGKHFSFSFRNKIKKIVPVFVACMAVLLILRGMNLNIPYVSPFFYELKGNTVINCGPHSPVLSK